nr:hypothetical protein [Tanacetum cinerariifolium]
MIKKLTAFLTVVSGGIGGDGVKDYSHLQYFGNGEVEGRSLVRMGAETRIDFIDRRATTNYPSPQQHTTISIQKCQRLRNPMHYTPPPTPTTTEDSATKHDESHEGKGKYAKREDVKGWVYRCNQFFKIDDVPKDIRMELASMHDMYEQESLRSFEAVFKDLMVELKNLKQDGTVQHYQELFEATFKRLELNVYCLAKMQEGIISDTKSRYTPVLPTPRASPVNTYANKGNGYVPKA